MKISKTAESTWRPVAKRQQEKTHMDSKCNPFRSGPFRSVSGGGGQRRRENLTERDINNIYYNNNSTVPLEEGVRGRGERLRETVRRFVSAVRSGEQTGEGICPFYDDSHPAVAICIALTRDYGSFRRWRQFERQIPDGVLREELARFYAEIRSGEDVRNRGAALNKRLGRLLGGMAKGGAR